MLSKPPIDERIKLLHSSQQRSVAPHLPDSDDVMRELEGVLRSRAFRQSPKQRKFLGFLVEETLAGREHELTAARIAERVFGKEPGFKSSEDPLIRVAANRLRTALALYNGAEGTRSDVLIDLTPGSYVPVFSFRTIEAGPSPVRDVLQQFASYLDVSSARTHAQAYRSALTAVQSHPDDGELQAIYAVLAIDTYQHGFDASPRLAERAGPAMERALSLAPANPQVQFYAGLTALTQGDLLAAEKYGRKMLGAGLEDEAMAAQAGWLIAMTLEPRDVYESFQVDLSETSEHPGWMHHPRFLASYQAGDYEGALCEAIALGMPRFFWGPLERAAALAQLGLRDAAEREMRRAAALNPYLVRDPELYLKVYIPDSDTLQHVLEGLEKAGLDRAMG